MKESKRAKKKLEKNPVVECNKIQKKYYPELFKRFAEVNDQEIFIKGDWKIDRKWKAEFQIFMKKIIKHIEKTLDWWYNQFGNFSLV